MAKPPYSPVNSYNVQAIPLDKPYFVS